MPKRFPPESNPGARKDALDHLDVEWQDKAAGVVGYGIDRRHPFVCVAVWPTREPQRRMVAHSRTEHRLELSRPDDGSAATWHLRHDPTGGFTGMAWHPSAPDRAVLARQHAWLSTSRESGCVRVGLAQTRDRDGVDVMSGLVLKRIGADASERAPLTDRTQWFDALADLFGLTFAASPSGTADRLWERTITNHRTWEAAQT